MNGVVALVLTETTVCVSACMCVRERGWLLFVRQSSCVLCMVVGKQCESDIKECQNEVVIYKQQYFSGGSFDEKVSIRVLISQ